MRGSRVWKAASLFIASALLATGSLGRGRAQAGDPSPAPAAPAQSTDAALDAAFLPKAELHVPEFLRGHPEHDGRGVLVAVLDTGVDPGHPRLAKTTTGEAKLADFLDATDDGLIDTSQPIELVDGKALGATGRRLTLGDHVVAGKKAGLGRIGARDVLPDELVGRVRAKRRERLSEAVRRAKEADTLTRPSDDARRAAEAEAIESLPDEAPAFDVLACEKADGWRVVIDTDADGDLAEEKELRDFGTAQEWVRLRDDCELDVAVRPDADGRRVRLLFDGNGHGTHVAGIIAGYEGPGDAHNGLAPGARILAIKIGNSRYGGPTTNFAILRALDWAGKRGARVVNMSFGGPSFVADAGSPDARAADAAIERYGLLCCFSAGNEGPGLSTVGSPATARNAISVGAFVSPANMKVSYAQLGPDPGERLFGFSSRGPLPGGDLGVTVVAPGAAWSTVPPWQLVADENMNGTSMAAPQVAGAAALLLSGALHDQVPAPPARVIRAIRATARPVEGLLPVEQGAGLVQVDRAFDALVRMKASPVERTLRARVVNPTGVGGGVYDRAFDASEPVDRDVRVSIDWPRETPNEERLAYDRRLVLASDSSWVQVPPRVALNAQGGSFAVRIDAKGLPEGIHCARVSAFDPTRTVDGPELVVPVTIVRPASPDATARWHGESTLEPGDRVSRFVRVPFGASKAKVRVTARDGARNTLSIALSSLDAWRPQEGRTAGARPRLAPGEEHETSLDVLPGTVLEVALFSHWNANAPAAYALDVRFVGPVSPDSSLSAGPGEDVLLLRLASPLGAFRGRVGVRLTDTVERPVVAKEVVVDSGDPVLGGDRMYVSRQRFSVRVAAGESVRVVPLGTHALDEQREDARWRITDAAGRVVKKAVIDGPFDLNGLPVGTYAVEYETPTWGRAAADAGLTGFEVRRARAHAWGTVYPTADLAADSTGESADVELPAGSVRSVALRLPGLDADRLHVGVVEVTDESGEVRLSIPLEVDRRTTAVEPDERAAEDALVGALRSAATAVADDPVATPAARSEASRRAERALTLRSDDVDLEILALRLLPFPAAKPADDAAFDARLAKAIARLDRAKGEDRPRLARLLLRRSRSFEAAKKADEAKADFAEARFLLGDGDVEVLGVRVQKGLDTGGDAKDALAAAKALKDMRPAAFEAAEQVVAVLVKLGWGIPAAAELRTWPDRYPARTTEFRSWAGKVRAAGGDPAPRTLAALEAAAP